VQGIWGRYAYRIFVGKCKERDNVEDLVIGDRIQRSAVACRGGNFTFLSCLLTLSKLRTYH
jgi:hypothetical protein